MYWFILNPYLNNVMERETRVVTVCAEMMSSNDCDRGGSTRSRCSRAAAVESVDPQRASSTAPCTREKVPGSPTTTVPPSPVTSLENRSGNCKEKM